MPSGKIHHWAGAIFVPGVSVDEVLKRLGELAGNEQKHYADVLASRLIARHDDRYEIFMKLRRSKVITVTYNTEHDVRYRRLGSARASARSVATRIAQLDDAGTPQEHELKPGSDSGYLWRLNAYWRYEAVPGGVLIECESVSLSRAVPYVLRPFATGLVEGLARESLERTLTGLRGYLREQFPVPAPVQVSSERPDFSGGDWTPADSLEQIVEGLPRAGWCDRLGLALDSGSRLELRAGVPRVFWRDTDLDRTLALEGRAAVEVGALRAGVQVGAAAIAGAFGAPRRRRHQLVAAAGAADGLPEAGHVEGLRAVGRLPARRVLLLGRGGLLPARRARLVLIATLPVLAVRHRLSFWESSRPFLGALRVERARPGAGIIQNRSQSAISNPDR